MKKSLSFTLSVALGGAILSMSAASAATFTSAQSGNYSTPATWGEASAHPGGGAGSDVVGIGAHTVTVTGSSPAATDTITINSGGTLSAANPTNNAFAGATINLAGGRLRFLISHGNSSTYNPSGDVFLKASSTIDSLNNRAGGYTATYNSLTCSETDGLTLTFTNSTTSTDTTTAVFPATTVGKNTTMHVDNVQARARLNNLNLASGATLTKTGPGILEIHSATGSGTIQGTVVIGEGTLVSVSNDGLGPNPIVIGPGKRLYSNQTNNAYLNTPLRLEGGMLEFNINHGNDTSFNPRGNITVASNSTINTTDNRTTVADVGTATYGTLGFAQDGLTLFLTNVVPFPAPIPTVTAEFVGPNIAYNATIDASVSAGVKLTNLSIAAGKTLTKTGVGPLLLSGNNSASIVGTINLVSGDLTSLSAQALGPNSITIPTGSTVYATTANDNLLGITPLVLNDGAGMVVNIATSAARTVGGQLTVAGDVTINTHNGNSAAQTATFGTLTIAEDTVGDGHELRFINVGGNATHVSTSRFVGVTVDHDAAINADNARAAVRLDNWTLGSGAVLTKRGPGLLTFFGAPTANNGSIALESGDLATGGNSFTVSRVLGGSGTVSGTGTLTLDSTAVIRPGNSTGTLTISNANLVMQTGSSLLAEIGGVNQGAAVDGYDHLLLNNGTANLAAGALALELVDGFVPARTGAFTVLTANSLGGTQFASAAPVPGGTLAAFDISYPANSVVVTNLDLFPLADIVLVGQGGGNYLLDGSGSSDPQAPDDSITAYAWDLTGNGTYDDATGMTASAVFGSGIHTVGLRVADVAGNFGYGSLTFTVPEPGSLVLLLAAGLLALHRRR